MNEQPANGSGDDEEDPLRVLEVSRDMYCDICWACESTTFDESDMFIMLLIICQVLVVLFITVDPVETTAGML